MNVRRLFAVVTVVLAGASALAKDIAVTDRFEKNLPISGAGSVLVNALVGNIDIHGTSEGTVSLLAEKTVIGVDKKAVEEGRRLTSLHMNGDERGYMFSTVVPPIRDPRWSSSVKYTLRVPRTIDVRIISQISDRILINDIRGTVTVNNFVGKVVLQAVTGPILADSTNGSILHVAPRGLSSAKLTTINGNIEVRMPAEADFQWVGESLKGDVRTTFPVRIRPIGLSGFRGSVNAAGGPTITTGTVMGSIFMLQNGTDMADAKVVKLGVPTEPSPRPQIFGMPGERFIKEIVEGQLFYRSPMGDVRVKEVRGTARVMTGAGEVNLGSVFGDCSVISSGGPMTLGEITGALSARTEAGDILVQAANRGGIITTGGGNIRLLYTDGPTQLASGGGDIVVRQAGGPINAETRSGDITITLDPKSKTERISAKTLKGNVLLNVTPRFAADIDATLITSDPEVNRFKSDFPHLTVQRDQAGGKVRIRVTGKVNGGGEKIELWAEDGGIQITTNSGQPISIIAPR